MINFMKVHDYFRNDLNRLVSSYYGMGKFKDTGNGFIYTSGCLDAVDSAKVQFLSERTKQFVHLSFEDLRFLEPLQ
jgi:hypothetical protein